MKLPSTIRFFDEDIKKAFYKLENGDNSEKELFHLLNQAIDNILRRMLFAEFKCQKD